MDMLNLPKVGSSVIVQCLQTENLGEMYRMESDPDVKRYLNGPIRVPREEWFRGMESKLSRCETLAVLAKDTRQFAGRVALNQYLDSVYPNPDVTREIQIVIAKDYRGRYFGREVCKILIPAAFDELGAEQVIRVVHPQNEGSIKLLQIFGFEQKGEISKRSTTWQQGHLRFALPRSIYQKWPPELRWATCQPTKPDLKGS